MSDILNFVKNQNTTINKIKDNLKDLNKQTTATKAKKSEELIANQVVYVEAIKMMGEEIFDLGMENEVLKNSIGEVDSEWINKSKEDLKINLSNRQKNDFILNRLKRQSKKLKQAVQ